MNEIIEKFTSTQFAVSALTAIAVIATIITLAMPLLNTDSLAKRMKSVSSERERIRQRERAAAKSQQPSKSIRHESKAYMKNIVEKFSLSTWLNTEDAKMKLASAGFRGPQAEIAFLFFRLVSPIVFFFAALFYVFFLGDPEMSGLMQIAIVIGATYLGIKAPEIFISNTISNRQMSMRRAFPDALDLMLICVESGMSIEHAFRKVGQEIGAQSIPLAEEFALATAELSYLPDRRTAYSNLAARTGLEGVKQISTVLIQAEKYGTPLGQALRITAQESRDMRMMEAEKKAAALPPKLTVPMIVFFLPVLMVVVLSPAAIQVMQTAG
ncbi:type II secretion system F family protein [Methylocystis parvus]|uniref:Type II secretion system F family protein n=1 Tax=Methylocystis parvus TaxID=134 RepID=A0A6B8MA96_9HYPH|nr:type II secretion system F family protein [Methylocystis parvus]QGM98519.1 type II secretion system F family protein [Methylocystis parvus]WBK01142.1 type II secretion system F family protein [Methylocystis parvus OBBP]